MPLGLDAHLKHACLHIDLHLHIHVRMYDDREGTMCENLHLARQLQTLRVRLFPHNDGHVPYDETPCLPLLT